jgi:Asp-tRNA(Asn)/Glu-tRNA(Gln) amidotransferase A subunit family amidase
MTTTIDLTTLTLSDAAAAIAAGAFTPAELTEAALARIAALDPLLNTYIVVTAEEARAAATDPPPGPLHGLPVALKDLFDMRGVATTAASPLFLDNVPDADSAVAARLRAAGAVLLGKLNMHQWALGVTNVQSHFGPVRNPWNREHVPGGSSGGSGAAVASGLALAALGSDTGGSIRIPAALCGVVGLKPTYGRVSLRGVIPLAWSLDHAGPLTRTVRDAALLLGVLAGYDPADPYSVDRPVGDYLGSLEAGARGLRVGVPARYFFDELDPEVEAAVRAALETFAGLGAELVDVDPGDVMAVRQASGEMLVADAAAYHEERLRHSPEGFIPVVYERMSAGLETTGVTYARARRTQAAWQRELAELFSEIDVLATPAVAVPAPAIADAQDIKPGVLTRFTNPFNLSGSPAISLPCGFTRAGLPIGLQLVGRWWDEATVLRAAHAYEAATDWHRRPPPLG